MYKQVRKNEWSWLRQAVVADDTDLTTFEYDNSAYPAAQKFTIPEDINSVAIVFWGKNTENYTAAYKLYGRRRTNGPIELLLAGNLTLGAQLVTKCPITKTAATAYWVDTITNTTSWIKAPVIKTNANKITYLCLATFGIKDLWLYIDLDGGGGTAASEINAIITGTTE